MGGDTFDYSLDRDTLHVSITDAVGHDVHAAMLATVLVGSLRNGRRRERGLLEQAAAANDALGGALRRRATSSPVSSCVSIVTPPGCRSSTRATRSRTGCTRASSTGSS